MSGARGPPASSPDSPEDEDHCSIQHQPGAPVSEEEAFENCEQSHAEATPREPPVPHGIERNTNDDRTPLKMDSSTPSKSITCQPQASPFSPALDGLAPETPCLLHNGGQRPPPPQKNGSPQGRPAAPRKPHGKLQSHPSLSSQSSKRSKGSSKSASSQIPIEAEDDCCVHCILACLFCEFLTLCNIVLDCTTCGSCASDDSCFCCCCGSEECGDCDLPCDMDCGIIDACCESADCLEICMECCGLCFSS
ncbi:myoD family inhibitor [Lepisosteus oculatus]|uniref:myoD family inhibitor n=1 Tax=Lepisosteus oculatus TaxID=7918 RepID=UPI00371D2AFE